MTSSQPVVFRVCVFVVLVVSYVGRCGVVRVSFVCRCGLVVPSRRRVVVVSSLLLLLRGCGVVGVVDRCPLVSLLCRSSLLCICHLLSHVASSWLDFCQFGIVCSGLYWGAPFSSWFRRSFSQIVTFPDAVVDCHPQNCISPCWCSLCGNDTL